MKLVFVNVMQELQRFDSTAYITQPPVPLGVLAAVTPRTLETGLVDEQTDRLRLRGDAFAFSVSTQNARAVYGLADGLRARGKKVVLGGIHPTVRPEEAMGHADAVVTGEAETIWPEICDDLLAGRLRDRYDGSPTPPSAMTPVDYRFFGERRYLTPASLFATRGCNRRCCFCVSSNHMGPRRTKPLHVLEREIDQLSELHPGAFLQFTDDNLLADRAHRDDLLQMLRRKGRRFVAMVTLDQLCDGALVEQMARSGCMGVAVGVESIDDDNCAALDKRQNIRQPLGRAVRHAHRCGIQTAALLMVGLPHDTPERLSRTLRRLQRIPCSLHDVRVLRIYPSTEMYERLVRTGEVTADWWLHEDSPSTCNHMLPSCLGVHFQHPSFGPMQLQRAALELTVELNRLTAGHVSRILRIGERGGGLKLAATILHARRRATRQARMLIDRVDRVRASALVLDGPRPVTYTR